MALSFTSRGIGTTSYATSVSTASFTPAANALLLAFVTKNNNSTDTFSMAGHGTWTAQTTQAIGNRLGKLYAVMASGSPSAAVVTGSWTGNTSGQIEVVEVTGHDNTSVAVAVVQSIGAQQYNSGGGPYTLSVTLAALADSNNGTMLFGTSQGADTLSTKSGWTNLSYGTTNGPIIRADYKEPGETTAEVASTGSYQSTAGIACEIKLAAAASSALPLLNAYYHG